MGGRRDLSRSSRDGHLQSLITFSIDPYIPSIPYVYYNEQAEFAWPTEEISSAEVYYLQLGIVLWKKAGSWWLMISHKFESASNKMRRLLVGGGRYSVLGLIAGNSTFIQCARAFIKFFTMIDEFRRNRSLRNLERSDWYAVHKAEMPRKFINMKS